MKIGAHISTAKPFSESVLRAKNIGCECMQIFANPPQRWNPAVISADEISRFREQNDKANIDPIIIHSIYLVNFASSNPFFYEASIRSIVDDMQKAEKIRAIGVNTHLGSTKGGDFQDCLPSVISSIEKILSMTGTVDFIIENAAGAGNIIGDTLEEIGQIVKNVNSDRVKVLIDTAHAFESGYDLRTRDSLNDFVGTFDKEIGLDRLAGFHLNDSKTKKDSKRDRHADIGEGEIGIEAFSLILNHPNLKDLFGILETPQDILTWKEQISLLKGLEEK